MSSAKRGIENAFEFLNNLKASINFLSEFNARNDSLSSVHLASIHSMIRKNRGHDGKVNFVPALELLDKHAPSSYESIIRL